VHEGHPDNPVYRGLYLSHEKKEEGNNPKSLHYELELLNYFMAHTFFLQKRVKRCMHLRFNHSTTSVILLMAGKRWLVELTPPGLAMIPIRIYLLFSLNARFGQSGVCRQTADS